MNSKGKIYTYALPVLGMFLVLMYYSGKWAVESGQGTKVLIAMLSSYVGFCVWYFWRLLTR